MLNAPRVRQKAPTELVLVIVTWFVKAMLTASCSRQLQLRAVTVTAVMYLPCDRSAAICLDAMHVVRLFDHHGSGFSGAEAGSS